MKQKSQRQYNFHMKEKHPHIKFFREALFSTYNSAYRQTQQHFELSHKCEYCDKRFMYPHLVRSHETLHTGTRKRPCEWQGCKKKCTSKKL